MGWFKEVFEKTAWKTIYACNGKSQKSDLFGDTYEVPVQVILKVSTNKVRPRYKCYATDGIDRVDVDLDMLVFDRPEVVRMLADHGITC